MARGEECEKYTYLLDLWLSPGPNSRRVVFVWRIVMAAGNCIHTTFNVLEISDVSLTYCSISPSPRSLFCSSPEVVKSKTHVESGKLWQLTETAGLN